MLRYLIGMLPLFLFAYIPVTNIHTLSIQAKSEHKHLLLFFHKHGCGYCKKMKDVTIENKVVKLFLEKYFIMVDIGINDEGIIKDKDFSGSKYAYAKSLTIDFYPTVGFVDANNTLVHGVVGYRDAKSFITHLEYVEQRAYQTMGFEDFKTYLDFQKD